MLIADRDSYVLTVFKQSSPKNQRKADNPAHLICFGEAYHLGERHRYNDNDHFMREMYLDVVGHDERGAKRYERMVNIIEARFRRSHNEWAVDTALLHTIQTKYIILPLLQTSDSGIAMTVAASFPLPANHIGWVYADKAVSLQQIGRVSFTAGSYKAIHRMLSQIIEQHNQNMQGQSYGYELYRYGRCIDGDCEICGDLPSVIEQIEVRLPAACRGMTRFLESGR